MLGQKLQNYEQNKKIIYMSKILKAIYLYAFFSLGLIASLIILIFIGKITLIESLLIWGFSICITLIITRNDLSFIYNLEKNLSHKIKLFEKKSTPINCI